MPEILRLTFGIHEAYRRLGIPSEDIFIHSEGGPHGDQVLVVAHQGARSFAFNLGLRRMPIADFEGQWGVLVSLINDGTVSEERLHLWLQELLALIEGGAARLVLEMQAKGFVIGREVLH